MNAHSKEQREFIVLRLARFEPPSSIIAAFLARFTDTRCVTEDLVRCDPRIGVIDPDLHSLFYQEQQRCLGDATLAPFADKRARILALSRLAEHYLANNQAGDARSVFRQIAEEQEAVPREAGTPDDAIEVKQITRTVILKKEAA